MLGATQEDEGPSAESRTPLVFAYVRGESPWGGRRLRANVSALDIYFRPLYKLLLDVLRLRRGRRGYRGLGPDGYNWDFSSAEVASPLV